ncbi:hypothetical protein RvY_05696 [Ramazzottius varieornatus]|uniref:Uncharacterized protein n=1 Tax=Ramazzottius varieornatus TaxID=947166 RepID=A0A1D1UVW7_RAMVA|nr:hypothetical protein RvY_05696 [Ramazzottius varieornatus]
MVKNQNKGKRKADTQKMGKKPSTSTSPIGSIDILRELRSSTVTIRYHFSLCSAVTLNLDQYVTEADEFKPIDKAVMQCTIDVNDPLEDDEEAAKTVEAFEKSRACFETTSDIHSRHEFQFIEYCNTRADTSYGSEANWRE